MKLLVPLLTLLLLIPSNSALSQVAKNSPKYIAIELNSTYFTDQKRKIKIVLPDNYSQLKKYPVIYTLDGNSLFDLTSNYVAQLSKLTIENNYDYATDVIPQSIVVGIYHNDRNYETTPNFSQYSGGDETIYTEGSEKLKKFLFEEVIPYVDANYTTSGYNSIIGHSNTAHFVMCLPFQENNPFSGIVSLSLSGESKQFKKKIESFLSNNEKTSIFIGYGTKDFGFNEFAKQLEKEQYNYNLLVNRFDANHNETPAISMVNAIKFLFKEYRNIEDFYNESLKNDFKIGDYLELYSRKNKNFYGISTKLKEDDFYSLIEMSIISKNENALNQLIEYNEKVNGYQTQTHMMFVYNKDIGSLEKAEFYARKMLNSKDDFENRILNANLQLYYNFYAHDLKDIEKTIDFFEKGKTNFKKNKLEYSYFIAKASIESNTRKKLGKNSLDYCIKNYRHNRYFREDDLKKMAEK
jgi:predicted alpha/beta superfamily hydrolase